MRKSIRLMHSAPVDLMFNVIFFLSQSNKHFASIIMGREKERESAYIVWPIIVFPCGLNIFLLCLRLNRMIQSQNVCWLKRDFLFVCKCFRRKRNIMHTNMNRQQASNRSKILFNNKKCISRERARGQPACRCFGVKLKFITSCVVCLCFYVTATKI